MKPDEDSGELLRLIALAFGGAATTEAERKEAERRLFERLHPRVHAAAGRLAFKYRGAFRHRGGQPPAADFTATVNQALWRNGGRALLEWEGSRPLAPYLERIARNAIIDRVRALNAGRPDPFKEDPALLDVVSHDGPGAAITARADLKKLLGIVAEEAPPGEREVFELCMLRGEEVHEAAKLLGLSDNTVSARLARLRKRLDAIAARWFPERVTKPAPPDGSPAPNEKAAEKPKGSAKGKNGHVPETNGMPKATHFHDLTAPPENNAESRGDEREGPEPSRATSSANSRATSSATEEPNPEDAPPSSKEEHGGPHDAE